MESMTEHLSGHALPDDFDAREREIEARLDETWRRHGGPYSPAGFDAYVEAQNSSFAGAERRALRHWRQDSTMRIGILILDTNPHSGGGPIEVDELEVYGWRAALSTVRTALADVREGAIWPERYQACVFDARLVRAAERFLDCL